MSLSINNQLSNDQLFNDQLLNFNDLTVDKLTSIYENKKNLQIQLNDKIANLDKNNLTYWNCFEYSMQEIAKHVLEFSLLQFNMIHPDTEIRNKSTELNKQFSAFGIEQVMRQDVYDVISHYYKNQYLQEQSQLTVEQKKYVENIMIDYNMMGLGLDEQKKEQIKKINKKLSEYGSDYVKNISDVKTEFIFELFQLEGMNKMDDLWLTNRLVNDTKNIENIEDTENIENTENIEKIPKYKIKLTHPDYWPIMEYCENRSTRKLMFEAMGSRCLETNIPIILDTIKLRKEKAELFGFTSYSDYKLQNMMAKNSSTVMLFLNKLLEKIKPVVQLEIKQLNDLAYQLDGLNSIESWDKMYYSRIYTEKMSGLNMSDLKKMFTIESVTNGIFSIYQELLGLKFVDITESNPQALYSNDVKLFGVFDASEQIIEQTIEQTNGDSKSNPIDYFYLDLFPRDGKYSHAAMFSFVAKSKYNKSISAIVCNFDPKLNVEFDNVVTYFHEFGHLMHNVVSTNTISSLAGTCCQDDFVETPSQMFEEWCYHEEPLKRLVSTEYIDCINSELINKINNQQKQLQGIFNATQLSYGLLDQSIHSANIPENPWAFHNDLIKEFFGWELPKNVYMLANWSHMYGYDSLYYGYLWSKVYSIDLFSFFKSNPMNKELGMKLRNEILSKGGQLDGIDLLKNFMEREPNTDAYIEWLSNV